MGFVRIFGKNNVQEAYLPKMSISGKIVSEIVAQLCLENSIQTLLIFFWVDPQKGGPLVPVEGCERTCHISPHPTGLIYPFIRYTSNSTAFSTTRFQ